MELRDYQKAAVAGTAQGWQQGTRSGLVVLPTGTGKSLVIGEICRQAMAIGASTIVATHVKELVEQDSAEFAKFCPGQPFGIYCAGLGRKEADKPLVFGSIQSLRDGSMLGRRSILLIDEAHLVSHEQETQYGAMIRTLVAGNGALRVAGFTATPFRLSTGNLIEPYRGRPPIFERVFYEAPLLDMIKGGWLAPLKIKQPKRILDVRGVKTRMGEFAAGELERKVDTDEANEAIVEETIRRGADRKSWIVFATGVDHAQHLADAFMARDIFAVPITADTPDAERDHAIAEFKAGRIRALVSVGVLTTGFNAPCVDLIAMARPTKSCGLWVQMLGRGMRTFAAKKDCLVLDFAGNGVRLGLPEEINGQRDAFEIAMADAAKCCPECQSVVSPAAIECTDCGHVFAQRIRKPAVDPAAAVSTREEVRWFDVRRVEYGKHVTDAGSESMRVKYTVLGSRFPISEFIKFDSEKARPHVERWWAQHSDDDCPDTVSDALRLIAGLAKPSRIKAKRQAEAKWWSVTWREFRAGEFGFSSAA